MTRRVLVVAALAVGLVVLLASPTAGAAPPLHVRIEHYRFEPIEIVISSGDTVTWTNSDHATHDVTSLGGPEAFTSSALPSGASWSKTFTEGGTYEYYCVRHPEMTGRVVVNPSATTSVVTEPAPLAASVASPPRSAAAPAPVTSTTSPRSDGNRAATPTAVLPVTDLRPVRDLGLAVVGVVGCAALLATTSKRGTDRERPR